MIIKIEISVQKVPKTKFMEGIQVMMVDLGDLMVAMMLVKDKKGEMIVLQKRDH